MNEATSQVGHGTKEEMAGGGAVERSEAIRELAGVQLRWQRQRPSPHADDAGGVRQRTGVSCTAPESEAGDRRVATEGERLGREEA